jgi:hypothetical protein
MSEPKRDRCWRRELHGGAKKLADGRWKATARVVQYRDGQVVTLDQDVPIDHEPFDTCTEAIEHGTTCAMKWSLEHP